MMTTETTYRGRHAFSIENDKLRVTVLAEGGHIAELFVKATGVNPLWTPPWPTIEPSTYERSRHPEYGTDSESKLLAGIHGHNICLDLWGPPSEEEAAAGLTVHGEAAVARYAFSSASPDKLHCRCLADSAQLAFTRDLELQGSTVQITECVQNLSLLDRPIAWTEHVTLGPPFLKHGETVFAVPATRSVSFEGEVFDWPVFRGDDLRTYTSAQESARFTTHMIDPAVDDAFFTAYTPSLGTEVRYDWQREDFPWIGIWDENRSRKQAPWNGETVTRGMEFGVSPVPETRRKMIERGSLFGIPAYRWVPAHSSISVRYTATAHKRG